MSVEVKVPHVGESITEVFIGEWLKSEGQAVQVDENLVELESDKATFEVPSPSAGVIESILKQPGDSANVGDVIATINENAEAKTDGEKPKPDASSEQSKPAEQTQPSSAEAPQDSGNGETRVMPAAQRLLAENNLSASSVQATGPGGRILKEDVQRHLSGPPRQPASQPTHSMTSPNEPYDPSRQKETVRMTPMRRSIAERLVESQRTAALLTTFNDVDMSKVMKMRNEYKDAFQKKYGMKLGFMSFFVKAAVDALNAIPQLNAQIDGDQIIYHNYCDIGVAIGGGKGLVVPVLRNAERMSFSDIEQSINNFAERAKSNKIELKELQGGTFTISNGGVYGSLLSTPIINPPQSGVLGMHRIEQRPVAVDGQVVIRPMMYLALTYDHRIVDGREAVTFLKRIKDTIEEPARMLLEV